jgi:hypothetical protein
MELDAVGQGGSQHLGDEDPAEGGQVGLGAARLEEDLEGLAVRVAAQVVGAGDLDRSGHHRVRREGGTIEAEPGQLGTDPVQCA